jgi:hypothetical protein
VESAEKQPWRCFLQSQYLDDMNQPNAFYISTKRHDIDYLSQGRAFRFHNNALTESTLAVADLGNRRSQTFDFVPTDDRQSDINFNEKRLRKTFFGAFIASLGPRV